MRATGLKLLRARKGMTAFGSDSSPSRGDPCRRALRPIEASKTAACYVRSTSIPDVQTYLRLTPKGRLFRSDGSDVAGRPNGWPKLNAAALVRDHGTEAGSFRGLILCARVVVLRGGVAASGYRR